LPSRETQRRTIVDYEFRSYPTTYRRAGIGRSALENALSFAANGSSVRQVQQSAALPYNHRRQLCKRLQELNKEDSILKRSLTALQAGAVVVGVVVGIGIFKTPAIVAANVACVSVYLGLWLLGGVITLIGALCYAELGTTYPHVGGEYHFLRKAYGRELGFLFAWGRMTVMQSGSIAAVAFVYGDYASFLIPAGPFGPAIHAALAVIGLSALQLIGTQLGSRAQLALTSATVVVILIVAVIGLIAGFHPSSSTPSAPTTSAGAAGLAMVFILLTYGGWSEASYLSGEVRNAKRDIPRALLLGTVTATALYLLSNLAYLFAFGLEGLRQSKVVAADLVAMAAGTESAAAVATIVCITSLSTLNATVLTGARSIYALGRSFPPFAVLGRSAQDGRAPRHAILLQAAIATGLVAFGAFSRDGFETMVEYTAPVFWTFMLLVGSSLFVFRWRDPNRARPFQVPLYPVTPLIFCATSAYLLYSSLVYTGAGALVGVGILLAGIPIFRFGLRSTPVNGPARLGGQSP
jgi:basic amino acid/polyamine antiporter, APA family